MGQDSNPSEEAISYYFGNYLLTPLALSEEQIEKSIFFILDFTLLDSTEPIDPVVSLIKLLSQLPPKIRFLILGLERGNDGKCIRYSGTHMVPLLAQSTNMQTHVSYFLFNIHYIFYISNVIHFLIFSMLYIYIIYITLLILRIYPYRLVDNGLLVCLPRYKIYFCKLRGVKQQ